MRERRETNSMEPTQLPRTNDSDEAAAILAGLQEKKEAGLLCLYPDCLNERQPSTVQSGLFAWLPRRPERPPRANPGRRKRLLSQPLKKWRRRRREHGDRRRRLSAKLRKSRLRKTAR